MSLFRALKYITNFTESKSKQIMKIVQIIYNYYVKPNITLDIYIVKLQSCIVYCVLYLSKLCLTLSKGFEKSVVNSLTARLSLLYKAWRN